MTRFATPEEFRNFFKEFYGPTIATYQSLHEDHSRMTGLVKALAMEWEYPLTTATAL